MPLVLQIIPTLFAGGAERFVVELASRLPTRGYRTKVVVLFEGGPLKELLKERGVDFVQLSGAHRINRFSLMRRLSGLIRTSGDDHPAIVHTHLFGGDFWTAMSQFGASRHRSSILISTAHNIDSDDGLIRRSARKFVAPMFDRVISVSDDVKDFTVKELGVIPSRAMTIDGMCLLQPDRRIDGSFHAPPRIVSVARLTPQKGLETALRALADIPPPWQYTIVGSGPLERDLKELAERLGIASRIVFAGVRMDVASILRDSDLFLFPSRWEGLGSAALEAAWAGVPVLTSDIGPLKSVFPASQRLPVDDVPAWTRAISSVLSDPSSALASASDLAPGIVERFHPDRIVERYARVYDGLLNG